jgi:hypothetical protein
MVSRFNASTLQRFNVPPRAVFEAFVFEPEDVEVELIALMEDALRHSVF